MNPQFRIARKLMTDLNVAPFLVRNVSEESPDFVRNVFSASYDSAALALKIDEIQNRFGCLVYYVTHEIFPFGEMYSFLIVSKYPEDWKYQVVQKYPDGTMSVDAYVWNVTNDRRSEMGRIIVKNEQGLLDRVG